MLIDHNKLTLYQITEPLQTTSSATSADPAPYGRDINGAPLNDPIPDTVVDPSTGLVTSSPASGTSALLDKWTVTKPEIANSLFASLSAPEHVQPGGAITYAVRLKNTSQYSLNGTQVKLQLPPNVTFAGTTGDTVSVHGNEVVLTVGRLAAGGVQSISIEATASSTRHADPFAAAFATVTSSTALPLFTNAVVTTIRH